MPKKDADFLKKLQATFALEANDHLTAIAEGLLELEKSPAASRRREIIEGIFRDAHSLKGAARAVGRPDVESVCRPLESLFANWKRSGSAPRQELFDLVHAAVKVLEHLLSPRRPESTDADQSIAGSLVRELERAVEETPGAKPPVAGREPAELPPGFPAPIPQVAADVRIPATGTIRVATSKLDALFRQTEVLIAAKLAAEQRVAELRDIAVLIHMREKAWNEVRRRLLPMAAPHPGEGRPPRHVTPAVELAHVLAALEKQESTAPDLARRVSMSATAAEADRRAFAKMIDNLLDEAKKLLMLPLASTFDLLPRIARDLAREQGKDVDLEIRGAEIEIDRRVQEALKDPLIHLIRNSVDHGIEAPAVRLRAGKPGRGTIVINVAQEQPGKAEIRIADDGAGIDTAKVLAAAQKLGAVSAEEAAGLDEPQIAALIFRSGVSTSTVVTDISGRGLGLAIVREHVEGLGGSVSVETRRGSGTSFRFVLPVTLAAMRAVLIRAGARQFALPMTGVERVLRVKREEIRTVENRETVPFNGGTLSVARLADVLGLRRRAAVEQRADHVQIAVIASAGERIGLVVDEVLTEQEILLKDLGSQLRRVRNIGGATVLGSGDLVPSLNVPDLVESCREFTPGATEAAPGSPAARSRSVLVVKDSITARALLKNILEASGYPVTTAVDGIDALTVLKTGEFDLVVSDVDMPRMDGFELTRKIRADRKFSRLPVVLVTALDSRESRERGIDAGADAYIVKSSFDQANLLQTIRRLV
jgi:two-component system chemotaxis sensor kinase CheA